MAEEIFRKLSFDVLAGDVEVWPAPMFIQSGGTMSISVAHPILTHTVYALIFVAYSASVVAHWSGRRQPALRLAGHMTASLGFIVAACGTLLAVAQAEWIKLGLFYIAVLAILAFYSLCVAVHYGRS